MRPLAWTARHGVFAACLSLACGTPATAADQEAGSPTQLETLNQGARQDLQRLQQADPGGQATATAGPGAVLSTPESSAVPSTRRFPWRYQPDPVDPQMLNRQQSGAQLRLQEQQRRDLMLRRGRPDTGLVPDAQRRLEAIGRQRRYQQEQYRQLDRFRLQQQRLRYGP